MRCFCKIQEVLERHMENCAFPMLFFTNASIYGRLFYCEEVTYGAVVRIHFAQNKAMSE